MIKSAEGSAGFLHKITKPAAWREGAQILEKEEEEDVTLLVQCEAKRKEWAKHSQCDDCLQNVEDQPWKNEELPKKLEEALTGVGCDGFHHKVPWA